MWHVNERFTLLTDSANSEVNLALSKLLFVEWADICAALNQRRSSTFRNSNRGSGKHFSSWFNNPLVRRELLPSAEGEIVVNLATREVVWTESGSVRSRPLEAFSSGEQAFAYTRARLAVLDEDQNRPPNRLIALDEFGAFIAHDRLTGLLAYLRER